MTGGDDLDTWLARTLHRDARVAVETLQELLAVAREERGESLARQLVRQGLLGQEDLDAYLVQWPGLAETQTSPPGPGAGERRRESGQILAVGADPGPWRPGGQVGPYTIGARIGAGGMGTVYRATHRETGTDYAIKTIAVHPGTEEAQRFQREGEAQAIVDAHPHVAKIHAAGHAAGRFYLVMDLAAGGDLAQRLEQAGGALAVEEAASIARALALALAHLHERGVLHRDMKPSNVLFDDRDQPRLVDFGLAKVTWQGSLTESGTLMGTPSYMAPEQASGVQRSEIGPPTDVYGLGAVLYELLAGRPPIQGQTVIEILSRLFDEQPAPPSAYRPGIPPALDALCLRMLAKQPDERPTAAEAARALETALEPAPARGPWLRVPLALAMVLGLVAVVSWGTRREPAGSGATSAQSPRSSRSPEPAPAATPSAAASVEPDATAQDERRLLELLEIPPERHADLAQRLEAALTDMASDPAGVFAGSDAQGVWAYLIPQGRDIRLYWAYDGYRRGESFASYRLYMELNKVLGPLVDPEGGLRRAARQVLERAAESGSSDARRSLGLLLVERSDLRVPTPELARARVLLGDCPESVLSDFGLRVALSCLVLAGYGPPTALDDQVLELYRGALPRRELWTLLVEGVAVAYGWEPPSPTAEDDGRALVSLLEALEQRVWVDEGNDPLRVQMDESKRLPLPEQAYRALAVLVAEGRVPDAHVARLVDLLLPFGRLREPEPGQHEVVEGWYPLAMAYRHGLGDALQPDPSEARDLLRRAAKHRHHLAQARLEAGD